MMVLLYLICVAFILLVGFYTYFTWTFDYWKRRNVPFEPPTVFVGNMTFALRETMFTYMRKLYRKFKGHDYFGIWMFHIPILVVRSPKTAKEVLVTNFSSFTDRAMETHESDTMGAKCLPIVKGEHWKQLRHRLSPAFTRAKIRNILNTRMPAISKELQELVEKEYLDKPNDVKILFYKYSVEVIAGTIFGVRANSMQDNNALILKLGMRLVDWTVFRGMEFMSIFLFPGMVKLFKFKFFSKEYSDTLQALFVNVFASRKADTSHVEAQSRDVVDALLNMKDSGSGYEFTEEDIVAQAAIFFFAGYESSSTTLSFVCYELAFNQEYQDSLYEEIKTLRAEKSEVDLDDMDDLKLLDMSIKETLRKYPVLPFADRLCRQDCELSDGLMVEKGTRVLICTGGLHTDEKYFPEPDRWNPYRFEKEKEFVPYTFMPFSEGQRICIGAKFAMYNLKLTLFALIERYRFEPCADTVLPKNLQMNLKSILITSDGPLMLNIIRR